MVSKYIFVTGGVLSSVGKGIVTSSIGKMLQARGLKVTAVKIDPYVNVDSGTMNPFQHGEVFVTEDGGEIDMDMGHYERFLNIEVSKQQNITTGQVYWSVIDRERRGDFLGQCVQIIPHVTDEIKDRIRNVGNRGWDLVLVECGGTVGDIEGLPFLEAARQMRLEDGFDNTFFVHVALVPTIDVTGESKTKPAQHSVQELRRIGIQPDVIVARSSKLLEKDALRKIALFGSVDEKAVFVSPTVKCVYELPRILDEQGLAGYICERLSVRALQPDWSEWTSTVKSFTDAKDVVKIAMLGKYAKLVDSYVSVNEALRHAGAAAGVRVEIVWIDSDEYERNPEKTSELSGCHGLLVPGGFGPRGTEGKMLGIKYARENNLPFLGICYGFQLASIEFARNVCGLKLANSSEIDPRTPHPVVDLLPEQKSIEYKGATMRLGAYPIKLRPNTIARRLYRAEKIHERHRHRYEINPDYWNILTGHGILFSGTTEDESRIEVLELPNHYFFFGTQFHPEFKSRPGRPDPAYYGLVKSGLDHKHGLPASEL